MTLLKWHKKYSVNNVELGNHHKTLFAISNRLYESSLGHSSPESIITIIEELIFYSHYHFSAEEQYMTKLEYKDIGQHINKHIELAERILQLLSVADTDEVGTIKELIVYLQNWLLKHLIIEDKKYSI